jgi:hypothetical protein
MDGEARMKWIKLVWDFYCHWRSRKFQETLQIDVRTSTETIGEQRLLFIEVQLKNAGNAKLEAMQCKPDEFVYRDDIEQLHHSCSLQIRRLNTDKLTGSTVLDWYRCPALEPVPDIPTEIDLLDEYRVPKNDMITDFWLEPAEIAPLSASVMLTPGLYLLKTSFYGRNIKKDFWSRTSYVLLK